MSWEVTVVRNRYVDSVRLMRIAKDLRARDGVARAEVAMGTPANLEALAALGRRAATPARRDVVLAVDGPAEALDGGRARAGRARPPGRRPARRPTPPRSLVAAARSCPGANVALISVPGEYAALEAHRALTAGLHVFLFSDHVVRRGRGRAQAARRRPRAARHGPGLRHRDARAGRARLRQRRAAGTGRHRRRRGHRRPGGGDPARRRRRRRLADHRRRRARPLGRGRRDHVPRGRCGCSPHDDATDTLLLVSKPPGARGGRAARRGRHGGQARRRRVRRMGGRRRPVRGPRDAGGRRLRRRGLRAARSGRAGGAGRRAARRRAAARPVLRRLARPRGRDHPRARARGRSAATRATAATAGTRSSTSARRSTRRAARTR